MENSEGESAPPPEVEISGVGSGPAAAELTDMEYLNILQSIGQAVHVLDHNYCIIYWNRSAEKLYGFSCEEALGEDVTELLGDSKDRSVAYNILDRVLMGENWTGQFPVLGRRGEKFVIVATNTPLYDDAGRIIGVICVSADSAPFRRANSFLSDFETDSGELGRVHCQPRQGNFPSKLSYSPSVVSEPGMMPEEVNLLVEGVRGYIGGFSTPIGDTYLSPFGVFSRGKLEEASPSHQESYDTSQMKTGISRMSSKEGSWIGQQQEAFYCSSAVNLNSKSRANTSSSTSSHAVIAVDKGPRSSTYDIMWEELTIGERIGQGSCGTVYRAMWYGSAVAVKLFSRQEYSEDVIRSFKQEVSLMKRLRHPNILLFMGAVSSPERLCIVTEFLPRGSLFDLLRKSAAKLEKRRLIHMALDIARGMNYLHCYNPPIVHRDLKSSNLLVDRNWTVKVGDFGLSRLKHETYLTTRSGKGTPQWMAPEVLRSEPSNEKADVYSYGVILWELVTHKIPWENLNPMQAIGAVGFMHQRLDIPDDVEPQWASLIESCFRSEPQCRPSFQELVEKLKVMQKNHAIQLQAGRAAPRKL